MYENRGIIASEILPKIKGAPLTRGQRETKRRGKTFSLGADRHKNADVGARYRSARISLSIDEKKLHTSYPPRSHAERQLLGFGRNGPCGVRQCG